MSGQPTKIKRRHFIQLAMAGGLVTAPARAVAASSPPPPLAAFARNPLVEHIALSPNGKHVAFTTTTQTGQTKLSFFSVENLETSSIGLGDRKLRGLMWTDDNHILFLSSVTERINAVSAFHQEFTIGIVVNTETQEAVKLFDSEWRYANFLITLPIRLKIGEGDYRIRASAYIMTFSNFGVFAPAEDWFYANGAPVKYNGAVKWRSSSPEDLRALSALGDFYQSVLRPDGTTAASLWMKLHPGYDKNKKLLEADREASRVRTTWKVTIETKEDRAPAVIYTLDTQGKWLELEGLGSHGNSLLVKTTDESGVEAYRELSLDGVLGADISLRTAAGAPSPLFHPETGLFVGFAYSDDWVTYNYNDPLMGKLSDGLKVMFPNDRVSIAGFSDDPRVLIAYCENSQTAGTYYHVDFSTGETIELPPNYPHLPAEWVAHKKPIGYKARDGLDIAGYLTLPPHRAPKNLPLIVLPHGGPEARDFGGFDWQAQAFASRGYAVLQPNFRGSSGYGKAFHDAAHGEWGRKMQTDLVDGIQHLAAKGMVDPARAAVVGASYGGYAALAGATLDTNVYRCAVSIAGVSDPESFVNSRAKEYGGGKKSWVVRYWRKLMGDAKNYDDISPLKQAQRAYCPILLVHGQDDTVVEHKQSQQMAKALQRLNKPYELVIYKQQDHWESLEADRIDMIEKIVGFLEKHNPA